MTTQELQTLIDAAPVLQAVVPWNLIVPALVSAVGMFTGGKSGSTDAQMQNLMTPEMREMLQIQLQRMRGQEPLYNDVMGMARGLLPTRYRRASGIVPTGAGSGLFGLPAGTAYQPNPKPGDYEGAAPKPGPSGRWTPPGV